MAGNPFLDRIAQKGKQGHGTVSERRLAKEMGKSLASRLTPASGALPGAKGDMQLTARREVLLEAKSTVHATMSLELGWLNKIVTEALNQGKMPALTVSFVNPDGKPRQNGDWVMLPRQDYEELLEMEEPKS